MFEAYALFLTESGMPVCRVADNMPVTRPGIWRVFDYWIQKSYMKNSLSEATQVVVDETSREKRIGGVLSPASTNVLPMAF